MPTQPLVMVLVATPPALMKPHPSGPLVVYRHLELLRLQE